MDSGLSVSDELKATEARLISTTKALRKVFPEQHGEATMYYDWPQCKDYAEHVLTVTHHWQIFLQVDITFQAPLEYVILLRDCAGYLREMDHRPETMYLAEIGLKILETQDFSSQGSYQKLDLLKAHFMSIIGSVSIQLLDFRRAEESLDTCFEIRNRYRATANPVDYQATRLHMGSMFAARKRYPRSIILYAEVGGLDGLSDIDNSYGRQLRIHAATMAGRVYILDRKFDKADNKLRCAELLELLLEDPDEQPTLKRSIEYERGNLRLAKGEIEQAKKHYKHCVLPGLYDGLTESDEERTVSIYHKLAVIHKLEGNAEAAKYDITVGLGLCISSPRYLAWKGRFYLLWARLLEEFPDFAARAARVENDSLENHEVEVERVKIAYGFPEHTPVTDKELSEHISWHLR